MPAILKMVPPKLLGGSGFIQHASGSSERIAQGPPTPSVFPGDQGLSFRHLSAGKAFESGETRDFKQKALGVKKALKKALGVTS
jgi:hypothetical protein